MENVKYSEEIEKVINEKRTSCRLYGTEECELLNMESCGECPVGELNADKQEKAKAALRRLREAAPPEKIEKLYTSHRCFFCKNEPAEEAECYALADLKKADPEGDWTVALGRKKLSVKGADMVLPLQISCCKKCRAAYRAFDYLPTVAALIAAAAGFIAVSQNSLHTALYNVKPWLPAAVMVGTIVFAVLLWFVLKLLLRGAMAKRMKIDLSDIPEIAELMDAGFSEVNEKKNRVSRLVFSRELRKVGVYSRVTEPMGFDGGEPTVCGEPAVDDNGEIVPMEPELPEEDERPIVCGKFVSDTEEPREDGEELPE